MRGKNPSLITFGKILSKIYCKKRADRLAKSAKAQICIEQLGLNTKEHYSVKHAFLKRASQSLVFRSGGKAKQTIL